MASRAGTIALVLVYLEKERGQDEYFFRAELYAKNLHAPYDSEDKQPLQTSCIAGKSQVYGRHDKASLPVLATACGERGGGVAPWLFFLLSFQHYINHLLTTALQCYQVPPLTVFPILLS